MFGVWKLCGYIVENWNEVFLLGEEVLYMYINKVCGFFKIGIYIYKQFI